MSDMPVQDDERDTSGVNVRRAEFVYEAARLQAISNCAPIIPEPWNDRETTFQEQFIRVVTRQCGADKFVSPEAAHDSWWRAYEDMGWVYGPVRDVKAKTHPDMVPFAELGFYEQVKDRVFLDLCAIAEYSILENGR